MAPLPAYFHTVASGEGMACPVGACARLRQRHWPAIAAWLDLKS